MSVTNEDFRRLYKSIYELNQKLNTSWTIDMWNWSIFFTSSDKKTCVRIDVDYRDRFDLWLLDRDNIKYSFNDVKYIKKIDLHHAYSYAERVFKYTTIKELIILFNNIEVELAMEKLD